MLITALLGLHSAFAFCGTYVGSADAPLSNTQSRIILSLNADSVVLTMANDVEGDVEDFGVLIPVPVGFQGDYTRLVDRALIDELDAYTEPRKVAYTCADLYGAPAVPLARSASTSSGCGSFPSDGFDFETDTAAPYDPVDSDGVDIIDQFDLGEYTAFVLSAEGSDGLSSWLDQNGFVVSDAADALLGDYIAQGMWFLALRVELERAPERGEWLSPLQIRYPSSGDAWSLPIRLGATSSAGVQDLVLHVLTAASAGRAAISNYPETVLPEDECMLSPEDSDLPTWAMWEDRFAEATGLPANPALLGDARGFGWMTEYAWGSGACDPCTSVGPLDAYSVVDLGMDDAHYGFFVTRLHLRYTPDAVTQDLALYTTRSADTAQIRYMEHAWELESAFPACGGEEPEHPGDCFTAEYWARRAEEPESQRNPVPASDEFAFAGCSAGRALLALPLLLALGRRRRR